jgi:hypothetical protein
MARTPSGNPVFDAVVLKADNAYRAALMAPRLTPAQTTAATRKYLEAIITAGVLHQIATPDEMATLSELNRTTRTDRRSA